MFEKRKYSKMTLEELNEKLNAELKTLDKLKKEHESFSATSMSHSNYVEHYELMCSRSNFPDTDTGHRTSRYAMFGLSLSNEIYQTERRIKLIKGIIEQKQNEQSASSGSQMS